MIGEHALFTNNSDEWDTPEALFQALDDEFHFNLDPCSSDANAKCEAHYTAEDDGLQQDWGGVHRILQSSIFADSKVG